MNYTTVITNEIIKFIYDQHDRHSDGNCKSGCAQVEVGYRTNRYGKSEYFCNFGGYCIGSLNRHESVEAPTLDELRKAVVSRVEEGLKDEPPTPAPSGEEG